MGRAFGGAANPGEGPSRLGRTPGGQAPLPSAPGRSGPRRAGGRGGKVASPCAPTTSPARRPFSCALFEVLRAAGGRGVSGTAGGSRVGGTAGRAARGRGISSTAGGAHNVVKIAHENLLFDYGASLAGAYNRIVGNNRPLRKKPLIY